MAQRKRTAKDEAIIKRANTWATGAHRPRFGVEWRVNARAYAAECDGCTYFTGYQSKTKAARMIVSHCEAFAGDPGMSRVEIAEAQVAALRKDRKRVGGRGSARKKQAIDLRIRDLEAQIERLAVTP